MSLRRPNLLVTFGVLSAVPMILLAVVLSATLRGILHTRSVERAEEATGYVASLGLSVYVPERDVREGLRPQDVRTLNALVTGGFFGDDVLAIEIRNADGAVVYSKDMPPTVSPVLDDFAAVLAGRTSSHDARLGDREALRVSVPVTYPASRGPAGVATFYLAHDSVHADVAADTRKLHVILFGGLALFYLLLFPIVARASMTLRRQAADNERLARHDGLTSLPNRTVFQSAMEDALRTLGSDASVVVMVIDVDRFKDVNDRLGHHNGDVLLQTISERLRKSMRGVDVVARIGGDEFAVLMPRANASFSQQIAARLRDAIAEPVMLDGTRLVPSASIGIAFGPEHGGDFETLLHEADVAMYVAKQRGGGRFRIAEPRTPTRTADAGAQVRPLEAPAPAATV